MALLGAPHAYAPSPMSTELPESLRVPEAPRRLRFHRYQWVGLPLLFLVPVLALLGVFGESEARVEQAGVDLALEVRYADRYRYMQSQRIEVWVENASGTPFDTVVVAFDEAYVRRFSSVTFLTDPVEPFEVEVLALAPGASQLVWAELQAEQYGRHEGSVRAYVRGRMDTTAVAVSTLIFP